MQMSCVPKERLRLMGITIELFGKDEPLQKLMV